MKPAHDSRTEFPVRNPVPWALVSQPGRRVGCLPLSPDLVCNKLVPFFRGEALFGVVKKRETHQPPGEFG